MEEKENNIIDNCDGNPKKIEVVTGDGDLNISPVYEHIEVEKPRPKDSRTIIVPEVKENISQEENNEE